MSQQVTSFKAYRVDSNVLGYPAFAICTAYHAGAYIKAEVFGIIQTTDTETTSFGRKLSYSNNGGPESPVVFDEEFALEDALQQAEAAFSSYIHSHNLESSTPHSWPRAQFVEIAPHRLISVWALSPLKEQLATVRDKTQCEPLGSYLASFASLPTIKLSPLAL